MNNKYDEKDLAEIDKQKKELKNLLSDLITISKIDFEKLEREKQDRKFIEREKELLDDLSENEVCIFLEIKNMCYEFFDFNDIKNLVLKNRELELNYEDFMIFVRLSSVKEGFFDKFKNITINSFIEKYKDIELQFRCQLGQNSKACNNAISNLDYFFVLYRTLHIIGSIKLQDIVTNKFIYWEMFPRRKKNYTHYRDLSFNDLIKKYGFGDNSAKLFVEIVKYVPNCFEGVQIPLICEYIRVNNLESRLEKVKKFLLFNKEKLF